MTMLQKLHRVVLAVLAMSLLATGTARAIELPENDYPTVARADYVFACMQVNGESRDTLFKCSCSIDKISELLPFAAYEEAETIMSLILKGGEKVAPMRYAKLQQKVKRLKKAQVEAELRCF